MSITFEQIGVRITKQDAGLMQAGWFEGNVTFGKRVVIDGLPTSFVFLKDQKKNNDCEADIGSNCELLAMN